MGIVDDIKTNAIGNTLHLSNPPEDYYTEIDDYVAAMAENTSVEEMICDGDYLACSVGTERAKAVSAIGTLPNCRSVTLRDSLLNIGVCVTNLAKNSKSLETLVMENCLLQGTPEHFDLLKAAINDSPTFKTLRIHDCSAPNENVNLSNIMESLKEGLSIDVSGDGAKIQ